MQSVNPDVEKTKVLDGLTSAFEAARNLKQDMLAYLIDMALAEARQAFFEQERELPSRTDDRLKPDWEQ